MRIYAQPSAVDSILATIDLQKCTAEECSKVSKEILLLAPEKSKEIALLGLRRSDKDPNTEFDLRSVLTDVALFSSDLDSAKRELKKLKIALQSTDDPLKKAVYYLSLANYFNQRGSSDSSILMNQKALEYCDNSDAGNRYKSICQANISNANIRKGRYKEAVKMLLELLKNPKAQGLVVNNSLGICYYNLRDYEKALHYYHAAIASTDNPAFQFQIRANIAMLLVELHRAAEADEIISTYNPKELTEKQQAVWYYIKGGINREKKNYKEALSFLQKSLSLDKKLELWRDVANDHLDIGQTYLEMHNYDAAKSQLLKSVSILAKEDDENAYKKALRLLLESRLAKSDPQYYKYFKTYNEVIDSTQNRDLVQITEDLESYYQSELKDAKILSSQNEIKSKNTQNTQLLIFGALALGLAGALFGLNRKLQKQKAQITEQNKTITLQQREMKHFMSNNLNQLRMVLTKQNPSDKESETSTSNGDRIFAISLLQKILFGENTSDSDQKNTLKEYLSELCASKEIASGDDVKINCEVPEKITLAPNKLPYLGLLVNELLMNSIKHAFAKGQKDKTINIRVTPSEQDKLQVSIWDNGRGLPQDFRLDTENSTLGRTHIKEFLGYFDGSMKYYNDQGAHFDITLETEYA